MCKYVSVVEIISKGFISNLRPAQTCYEVSYPFKPNVNNNVIEDEKGIIDVYTIF